MQRRGRTCAVARYEVPQAFAVNQALLLFTVFFAVFFAALWSAIIRSEASG